MQLPIGYDEFGAVIDSKLSFVDKSLFIKDVIQDSAQVILITRPRRFGKTFNLSLLHYFFAEQVLGRKTQGLFDKLKIAKEPDYLQHQGKYPVINLTFKDIKGESYRDTYDNLYQAIYEAYLQHDVLLSSVKLGDIHKRKFEAILNHTAKKIAVQSALKNLSYYLYQCYETKPIILIDEYDTPIQAAYVYDYYDKAINLMRCFLSPVLKNNPYLGKAVLTGILRVAKESLFSGLNNIEVYSLFRKEYSQYFGFTEEEVSHLLLEAGLSNQLSEAKDWYNGYQIGDTVVYNPWSIANYLKQKGACAPYWVNTSDNILAKDLLINSSITSKEKFQALLQGDHVDAILDDNFIFTELKSSESVLWNLFLMTGYLKAVSHTLTTEGVWLCQLQIPNLEVKSLYIRFFKEWLASGRGLQWYNDFLDRLLHGHIMGFEEDLKQIMLQTASIHDVTHQGEAFYQGLIIGLTISLQKEGYTIKSNRESGYGRYDIMIAPTDNQKMGIIFELKSVKIQRNKTSKSHLDLLSKVAREALNQIQDRQYTVELKEKGVKQICKIGIAFSVKDLKIAHEIENNYS